MLRRVRRRRLVLTAAGTLLSLVATGCAAAPVIGQVLLEIGVQVTVTEGTKYVEQWVRGGDPPHVPIVTIDFSGAGGTPSTVTYAVEHIKTIAVSQLKGTVTITGSTCAWTITVAPGTTAQVEITGDEGESIRCDGSPIPQESQNAVSTGPAVQTSSPRCRARELQRDQPELVEAGCTVQGDVEISSGPTGPFRILYDNDSSTGLIVRMIAPGYVRAPFGASATDLSAEQAADLMRVKGCGGGGCTPIIVNWTG